jgi:hypothetical protein
MSAVKTNFKDLAPLKTFAKASKSCSTQVSPLSQTPWFSISGIGIEIKTDWKRDLSFER